jgi:spore coat polysaccharide biosynthesis predicted glycosyltransferase SpsG
VKLQLKGARFDSIEEIQKAITDQLNKIPAEYFSNAMKKLETHANLCITSNGSYYEQIKRKKNTHLLFLVFIALVRELLDCTV